MSSGARLLLAVVLGIVLIVAASVGLATAAVLHDGTVRVAFEDRGPSGDRVTIVLPASFVRLAVVLAPDELFRDLPEEAKPWLRMIGTAGNELAGCPDTIFVEVRNPHESVVVEKRNGRFIVRVENDRERLVVAFDAATLDHVMSRLRRIV